MGNSSSSKSGLPSATAASANAAEWTSSNRKAVGGFRELVLCLKAGGKAAKNALADSVCKLFPPASEDERGWRVSSDRLLICAPQGLRETLWELCVPSVQELVSRRDSGAKSLSLPPLVLQKRATFLDERDGYAQRVLPDFIRICAFKHTQHLLHLNLARWSITHLLHYADSELKLALPDAAANIAPSSACYFQIHVTNGTACTLAQVDRSAASPAVGECTVADSRGELVTLRRIIARVRILPNNAWPSELEHLLPELPQLRETLGSIASLPRPLQELVLAYAIEPNSRFEQLCLARADDSSVVLADLSNHRVHVNKLQCSAREPRGDAFLSANGRWLAFCNNVFSHLPSAYFGHNCCDLTLLDLARRRLFTFPAAVWLRAATYRHRSPVGEHFEPRFSADTRSLHFRTLPLPPAAHPWVYAATNGQPQWFGVDLHALAERDNNNTEGLLASASDVDIASPLKCSGSSLDTAAGADEAKQSDVPRASFNQTAASDFGDGALPWLALLFMAVHSRKAGNVESALSRWSELPHSNPLVPVRICEERWLVQTETSFGSLDTFLVVIPRALTADWLARLQRGRPPFRDEQLELGKQVAAAAIVVDVENPHSVEFDAVRVSRSAWTVPRELIAFHSRSPL